jgi:hypothetical protein
MWLIWISLFWSSYSHFIEYVKQSEIESDRNLFFVELIVCV